MALARSGASEATIATAGSGADDMEASFGAGRIAESSKEGETA